MTDTDAVSENMPVYEGKPLVHWVASLQAEDPETRRQAAAAFVALGPAARAAVAPLVAMLSDPDQQLRRTVTEALGDIGPEARAAVSPLVAILSDSDEVFQCEVAEPLGQIGPEALPAVGALNVALRDSRWLQRRWLRREAARALGKIGPE